MSAAGVQRLLSGSIHLPVGAHQLTLDEIESVFVEQAPKSRNRAVLFRAFRAWYEQIIALFPNSVVWIDGGFSTYKSTIPEDIDTVAFIRPDEINSLTEEQYIRFEHMFSYALESYKPHGVVDAYYADPDDVSSVQGWADFFASVRDDSKKIHPLLRKGYLEVRASATAIS